MERESDLTNQKGAMGTEMESELDLTNQNGAMSTEMESELDLKRALWVLRWKVSWISVCEDFREKNYDNMLS
jgi:uncharacterized protein YqgV (UPF0045/DUF77 family)